MSFYINGDTITHITSGSIEKEIGTIKKANGHLGLHPASILLDPMNKSTPRLDKCFKSWCNYYHSRKNKHDASWKIRKIDHPLQKDHYNCGVFVIQFIKHYLSCRVENDKINFDCSPTSLECDRLLISSAIENYKKN